jgi:uncharacterized protein YgiM (DUF1202 family)
MKKSILLCALFGFALTVHAADYANTIRETELKTGPYTDAKTLASLPANSKVEVVKRQSAWTQVKAGTAKGWVRMLSLRFQSGTSARRDSGLGALFNVAKTGKSGSTVTTGVRGLSEEQLKNARPNPEELEVAKDYAAGKSEAKKFAAAGKLKAQGVEYVNGGK